jgi:hypothetical protein
MCDGSLDMSTSRIFLLSPARSSGKRAQMLLRPAAAFELARQLQIGDAKLGAVFTFCSGLYFRGKLTYAHRFARPPRDGAGVYVITPSRGLAVPETRIGLTDLREFSTVDVRSDEPRFVEPLQSAARSILATGPHEVVLLGSIATDKYVEALLPVFGEKLLFPGDFVGRGDMSRGGLLLRRAASGEELAYAPVAGAVRTGRRAARVGTL